MIPDYCTHKREAIKFLTRPHYPTHCKSINTCPLGRNLFMQTLTTLKMKTASFIFISCFLFTLSENFLPGTAQPTVPDPVLDTAGQPLHRGCQLLYLAGWARQRGWSKCLTLASGKNGSCPYEIVQSLNEGANGLQLTFSPVDNDTTIRANTDHNIRFINFSSPKICPQSNVFFFFVSNDTFV